MSETGFIEFVNELLTARDITALEELLERLAYTDTAGMYVAATDNLSPHDLPVDHAVFHDTFACRVDNDRFNTMAEQGTDNTVFGCKEMNAVTQTLESRQGNDRIIESRRIVAPNFNDAGVEFGSQSGGIRSEVTSL
jgi:hypothetical protein